MRMALLKYIFLVVFQTVARLKTKHSGDGMTWATTLHKSKQLATIALCVICLQRHTHIMQTAAECSVVGYYVLVVSRCFSFLNCSIIGLLFLLFVLD